MSEASSRQMRHLFDAEAALSRGIPLVAVLEEAGELIGSGTGKTDGPRLRGTLRWSNFGVSSPDHCQLTVAGEIETDDGAIIHFESRGFALPQTAGRGRWPRLCALPSMYRW